MVRAWLDSAGSLLLSLFLSLMVWLLISDADRPMQTVAVPASGGLALAYQRVPDGYEATSAASSVRVLVRGVPAAVAAFDPSRLDVSVDVGPMTPAEAAAAVEAPVRRSVRWRWHDDVGFAARHRAGVRVVGTDPATVLVRLDPVVTSTLRVEVELATGGSGIELGESSPSPTTVQVSGPRSRLARITRAVAQIDSDVLVGVAGAPLAGQPLVALDAGGAVVEGVVLTPAAVTVSVDPQSFGYRLPVVVEPRGDVPAGYDWRGLTYDPKEVHVFGPRAGIQALLADGKVSAEPVDLSAITRTLRLRAPLALPPDVHAVGLPDGRITVTVQVDVLPGSQQFTVDVGAEGVAPGLRAALNPRSVLVVLRGDRPVLDQLRPTDVEAFVSVRRLPAGVHRVPVELRLPSGLERVSVAPETIEVQIEPASGRSGD